MRRGREKQGLDGVEAQLDLEETIIDRYREQYPDLPDAYLEDWRNYITEKGVPALRELKSLEEEGFLEEWNEAGTFDDIVRDESFGYGHEAEAFRQLMDAAPTRSDYSPAKGMLRDLLPDTLSDQISPYTFEQPFDTHRRKAVMLGGLVVGAGIAGALALDLVDAPGPVQPAAAQQNLPAPDTEQIDPSTDTIPDTINTEDVIDIRPGVPIYPGNNTLCTANFIFADTEGNLYIGTAGHCATEGEGHETLLRGEKVYIGENQIATGEVVYSSLDWELDTFQDFSLVDIDDEYNRFVNASVETFGGPTGLAAEKPDGGTELLMYGMSAWHDHEDEPNAMIGPTVEEASLGSLTAPDRYPREVHGCFAPAPEDGDSGSPVLTADGEATAVYSHHHTDHAGGGIFLPLAIEAAEADLNTDLALQTAPLQYDGSLDDGYNRDLTDAECAFTKAKFLGHTFSLDTFWKAVGGIVAAQIGAGAAWIAWNRYKDDEA